MAIGSPRVTSLLMVELAGGVGGHPGRHRGRPVTAPARERQAVAGAGRGEAAGALIAVATSPSAGAAAGTDPALPDLGSKS
jgi:hypothetical protein